jgi:hypothetical protein
MRSRLVLLVMLAMIHSVRSVGSASGLLACKMGAPKSSACSTLMARGMYKNKHKAKDDIEVEQTGMKGMFSRMKAQGERNKKMLADYLKGAIPHLSVHVLLRSIL